jgi:predicted ATPase/DNA-binding SARP family transcriptional activator/tetratricopeptide (TPR) repeat protein
MLKLFCLGTLRLEVDAAPIPLTPKANALFLYLAVTQHAHSRDLLADLLWSETNNQQARANLRYLLPEVRQPLGEYLVITPQTIAFQRQAPYWLDVEQLRTTLMAHPETITTPALQAALDLYRGEFLAGFTARNTPVFEAWVTRQREDLHRLVVQGSYTLAERYWQQAAYQPGLAVTQRLLQWEPWHEAGHRLQIQLLAASSQRAAALAQYELCRTILAAELGVEPEAATIALVEQIRGGLYDKVTSDKVTSDKVTSDKVTERVPPGREVTLSPPHPVTPSPLLLHNLPGQLTPFFGRESEIAQIRTLLLDGRYRLFTLVGEGGIGKTRLALAVAQAILDSAEPSPPDDQNQKSKIKSLSWKDQKFSDGVWWIGLAGITTTAPIQEQLAVAVAQASGLTFGGTQPLFKQLLAQLRTKALLILCDNAEHLLPGLADFLVVLLQECPQVTVLVTSRHLLNLQAEFACRLDGLPVPPANVMTTLTPPELTAYSSILLFVERASRLNRNFQLTPADGAAVAAICRLVEGLPLAIELAAALTKQYSCTELYTALQRDYTILATTFGDLSPRHRSIQVMLDYSWRFLTPDEAHILAACAVFLGGFTRPAASAVTGATPALLTKLVDYSLLQVHEGRFVMHDLVRQYAAAQLDQFPAEKHTVLAHHAAYYMALLQGLDATLLAAFAAQGAVQSELDNVRTAWLWSASQQNLDLLAMGVESLQGFYRLAGLHQEAIYLLETALAAVRQRLAPSGDLADPAARLAQQLLARLLCYTAQFYRRAGGLETGERLAQEAITMGQRLTDPALQGLAYHELARLAQVRGDFTTMRTLAEQACAMARQAHQPHLLAESLNALGVAVSLCVGPLAASPHFHEARRALQGAANRYLDAHAVSNLGYVHLFGHEYQAAHYYLSQALILKQALQDREGVLTTQILLGDLWLALGAYAKAQQEYAQAFAIVEKMHVPYWASWLHAGYGRLQHLRGDPTAAYTACTLAHQMARQGRIHLHEQWALIYLGHALADLEDSATASQCYQQAIAVQKQANWSYRTADAHAGLAALLLTQNDVAGALIHAKIALDLLAEQGIIASGEPFRVYWTCVRVLQAAGDPRAIKVLRTATQTLQQIADQLEDATLRHSFLENVVVNRELLAAAQKAGIR